MTDPIREALAELVAMYDSNESRNAAWYVKYIDVRAKARAALAAPVAQPDAVALLDCRTCQNVSIRSGGCSSVFLCVDASMYKASPPVRYWKENP
jgi:hypothetical protein